jgi:hypothetical protein
VPPNTGVKDGYTFGNPFSVEVCDAKEKEQLSLADLQHYSILRCSFSQEALITFCAYLAVLQLSELRKLARNSASVFVSIC